MELFGGNVSGMSIIIHSSLQKGESSLMLACRYGHEEVVRLLLSSCAKVDLQDIR